MQSIFRHITSIETLTEVKSQASCVSLPENFAGYLPQDDFNKSRIGFYIGDNTY